ncbi:MAG: hypothetical protein R3E96_10305 [Planctomycetota bacterium]
MARRFITVEDIRRVGQGPLVVDADTIVTPQAQLAAQSAGIEIRLAGGSAWQPPQPDRGPDAARGGVCWRACPSPNPTSARALAS